MVLSPEQTAVAEAGLKALMPLGGLRLIDHALSTLAEIGVRRVLVVLGPHSGELAAHLAGLRPQRFSIETAVQLAPRGTADALLAAEGFVAGARFRVIVAAEPMLYLTERADVPYLEEKLRGRAVEI